jgi:DNA-binding MarR family transcriptional regulator
MDLIVTACRVLANPMRLQLLRVIYTRPGLAVRELAAEIAAPPAATSQQLKRLCNFHFIEAVPSGRQVFYRPAGSGTTANQFLRDLHALVSAVMSAKEPNRTPHEVCDSADASWDAVQAALMKLFTTYTHLRRLLLLRQLAVGKGDTAVALAERIGMSPDAAYRHLDKLRRRGVVVCSGQPPERWQVATHRGQSCRQKLLALVLRAMRPS